MREDLIPASIAKTIWDELQPTTIDTQKLEHLFESRAKDMMTKVKFDYDYFFFVLFISFHMNIVPKNV